MAGDREASAISVQRRWYDDLPALVVDWDFSVRGGSFGEHEADLFSAACGQAAQTRTPLITVLRSGGTRLQEGMRALVGIPRATLALADVRAAGVVHLAVAAAPTTGGVWVAIGSVADVRVGVRGATVGFSGPRVIEAMTGTPVPDGANTAESALAAGLLDDVVDAGAVDGWLARALRLLAGSHPPAASLPAPQPPAPPARAGWAQVAHSRQVHRPGGAELAGLLLDDRLALRGGDDSVAASLGSLHGRPIVVVAVAGQRAGLVTPAGYRLLERAARLAGHLDLPLVTLVDTAGADPLPASEQAGVAAGIADALVAVLGCSAPTVAVVHGEGGSGGALAAATCDHVAVTANGWFAALAPEGAAAALRRSPAEAADLMRVAPAQLLDDGFADAVAPAEPADLRLWLAAQLDRLTAVEPGARRRQREARWRGPLPRFGRDQPGM